MRWVVVDRSDVNPSSWLTSQVRVDLNVWAPATEGMLAAGI